MPYQQVSNYMQNVSDVCAAVLSELGLSSHTHTHPPPFLSNFASQEVGQFQNWLNRNMSECQSKAQDFLSPGEQDPRKVAKAEKILLDCMSRTVDDHIKLLKPMQDRIEAAVKQL